MPSSKMTSQQEMYERILRGPDTPGRRFLAGYLHKEAELTLKVAPAIAKGILIPFSAGSQAPEAVDVQNLSRMMEVFDEAVQPTPKQLPLPQPKPPALKYRQNPDYDENYVSPMDDDIPF